MRTAGSYDFKATRPRRQRRPLLISNEDRFRLLHGPYQAPLIKKGLVVDAVRGTVRFGGFTNAPIAWPRVRKTGRASLALCGDLVRALRMESIPAIAYHWGVSRATVGNWRRSLGFRGLTEGAERLVRIGVELARRPESRAKISAAARGRKLSARRKQKLFAGIRRGWVERRHARREQWRQGKLPPASHNPTPWLREEDKLLGTCSDQELVIILHRHLGSIRNRRSQLGIRFGPARAARPWTPRQDKLLGRRSDQELGRKLGRTTSSVANRRRKLGIRYVRPDSRPWTPGEERWLGKKPDVSVAKLLGRTVRAIQHRRLARGIRFQRGAGLPRRCE